MSKRCDLHLHSRASTNQDAWIARHFNCPESYAEPLRQYELCKARGMSFVTLTDHDTIAGGLELAHLPDFFLSEEVTTRFPEDGCIVHVLAWNIDPAQHERIQSLRANVYELVDYLRGEPIAHALAHPLESPNWKLSAETLEKLTLLFNTFEVVNGRAERRLNLGVQTLLRGLDANGLQALADRHGIQPARTGRAAISAGSDDHELRRAAFCYTEVDSAANPEAFLSRVMGGDARVVGSGADIQNLGVAFGHTTYAFLQDLAREGDPIQSPFADLMDALARNLDPARAASGEQREFIAHLLSVVAATPEARVPLDVREVPDGLDGNGQALADAQICVADRLVGSAFAAGFIALQRADFFGLFAALRDAAGGVKAMIPQLFAADHLGRQVEQMTRVQGAWTASRWPAAPRRLAVFSDTLSQVDGVSIWCRRLLDEAVQCGQEVWVPHSGSIAPELLTPEIEHCFEVVPEIARGTLPVYDGLQLTVPSLVRTLLFLQRRQITHVELATPGPAGMIGLIAAKLLRIPVRSTYHTEVPGLVRLLTGSPLLERMAGGYLAWFYGQVERVAVFSEAAEQRLRELGVAGARIDLRPLAVDPNEFRPAEVPSGSYTCKLPTQARPIVLSVGRLSPEKNLSLIVEAFNGLSELLPRPVLIIAGDGPERAELERLTAPYEDIRLVGMQTGRDLQKLYAGAAAFVFASEVDTFGLVTMEAMASGAPVLVPSSSSIASVVEHRRNAYCYELGVAGLREALREVLNDEQLAATLSRNGRAAMVARWRATQGRSPWLESANG